MRRPLPTLAFVVLVSVTPQLADGKPVAIPVVKTWGEFADQPPIDLGNGTKIRLGVEANECAVGGAVALYCLTEGYVPAGSWEGRDRFGPVRAKIARVGAKSVEALAVFCGASHEGPARGRFLFVQEVPMTATHPLRVEILSEKEKTLLAEATIQPSKQPFHTWTVFGREERIKIS